MTYYTVVMTKGHKRDLHPKTKLPCVIVSQELDGAGPLYKTRTEAEKVRDNWNFLHPKKTNEFIVAEVKWEEK